MVSVSDLDRSVFCCTVPIWTKSSGEKEFIHINAGSSLSGEVKSNEINFNKAIFSCVFI